MSRQTPRKPSPRRETRISHHDPERSISGSTSGSPVSTTAQ